MTAKEDITRHRFDKILIKFLLDEPFFSSIIRHMKKVRTRDIPTAGVTFIEDSITLYWNPDFIGGLSVRQVFGLLKHECYHLIFDHLTTRKQEPHIHWNIATDLAINSIIPLDELPEGGLIPGHKVKLKSKSALSGEMKRKSEQFSDFIAKLPHSKASEWYMEKIQKDKNIKEMIEDIFKPGKPSKGKKDGSGQPGGSAAGFDHHFENELSDADKALMNGKVKKIVKEAIERADRNNNWGSTPQSAKEKIRSMLKDVVDWRQVLHYFCGTKQRANKTRSFKKINRKYPYIHPGRKIKHTSNLAIYIDQSGSVTNDDISLFFGSLNELAKNVTFTVYNFDTNVDDINSYIWRKGKKFEKVIRTKTGGTDFDCVETHFRTKKDTFDGYIIMTDGCAPKPKNCISKRCWVLLPGTKLYFKNDIKDTVVTMEP